MRPLYSSSKELDSDDSDTTGQAVVLCWDTEPVSINSQLAGKACRARRKTSVNGKQRLKE